MNTTLTDDGITLSLSAREFDSLALFLAEFSDIDVVKTIGDEHGSTVNDIANQMVGLIISPKESNIGMNHIHCVDTTRE